MLPRVSLAMTFVLFMSFVGVPSLAQIRNGSELTTQEKAGATPTKHVAPVRSRRTTHRVRRLKAPNANPTRPGLDRCGISAVAVCPLR